MANLPSRLKFGPYLARASGKLGRGNFGTVLTAVHSKTGECVAVKIEADKSDEASSSSSSPRLAREANIYRSIDGAIGFPRMRWFGRAHGHYALVLDRLGPSLRTVHRESGLQLPLAHVSHVGIEGVDRLETLHDAGWLHLDVKPANLLLPSDFIDDDGGLADALAGRPQLACIDYGLSRSWRTDEMEESEEATTPRKRRRPVVGTGRFASLSNHTGEEPLGRRDDLEALLLSCVWLHSGKLPWSGIDPERLLAKRERFERMLECKQQASVEVVTEGLPSGFAAAFEKIRRLECDERPRYDEIRGLISTLP